MAGRTATRWVALGVVGAMLGVVAVLAAASISGARADLLAGQAQLQAAAGAASDGDLESADAAFQQAGVRLAGAQARLAGLPVRLVGLAPLAGENLAAARGLARAGELGASAGRQVTGAVAGLPDGLASFAPRDGTVPLEPLAAIAGPLAAAAERLTTAGEAIEATPRRRLLGAVADAREEAAAQVEQAAGGLAAGAAVAEQLPAFLGADEPRRYFLGAQNPAELRGTGGLIGAFGILTADQGRLDISDFRTIGQLTAAAPDELPPPSEDYAARYARFAAGVHGSNVNMTPDVPTAATAIETLYEAATGEPIDGTILADPLFLQALLEVVGPTEVPEVGTVDAGSVVGFVTRDQYAALAGAADRKEALGQVAGAVLRRFLAGVDQPVEAVRALGRAAADGRLRVHARDEAVQAAFATAGVAGGLADPDGDYLAVVGNNAAANKLDSFIDRDVVYDVRLQPDGAAHATLSVELTNTAPTEGLHQTVLGPNIEALSAGENRTYWSVYAAPGSQLTAFRRDGEGEPVTAERERGRPVYSTTVTLASGATQTLEYDWVVADAWQPGHESGRYQLNVDGQPALLEGATSVRVHPPDDGSGLQPDPPLTRRGGAAMWTGAPSEGAVLEAEVVAAPSARLARGLVEAFNRPLLEVLTGR